MPVKSDQVQLGTSGKASWHLVGEGQHFLGEEGGQLKWDLFRDCVDRRKCTSECECATLKRVGAWSYSFHIFFLSFLLAFSALWGTTRNVSMTCLPIWSITVAYLTSKDLSQCSFCWRLYNGWVILNGNMRVTNHFHTETWEITL